MSTLFSFVFFYLVLAFLFIFIIYFLNFGVWDPKLANGKLGERSQIWRALTPDVFI